MSNKFSAPEPTLNRFVTGQAYAALVGVSRVIRLIGMIGCVAVVACGSFRQSNQEGTMIRETLAAIAVSAAMAPAAVLAATGPSSSQTPYLSAVASGIDFTSILTVGDEVKKKHKGNETYRMVGIPDGLGAYDNGDGTITVLMNHELGNTAGVPPAHGGIGAFVSKWQIRKSDLKVLNGEDLIKNVMLWDSTSQTYVEANGSAFNRFCAAELPAPTAFFNSHTGKGFNEGRIFMNGEETDFGRAFAHMAAGSRHGVSYELPTMGRAAWENVVASPYEQDKTIVAGLDDGDLNASKVYFYVGEKTEEGSPIDLAGLTNGTAYAMAIDGYAIESDALTPIPNGFSGRFTLVASGGTGLNRVEDGNWDTVNPNRFYFVTTASFSGNSRLWRVTFDDITNPTAGGTIEILIDGITDGPKMMDNITVDAAGTVYMQEDVGNQVHLGKIWRYEPATDTLTVLAEHDATRFIAGASADIDGSGTRQSDEESSGIVEVTNLFQSVNGYDTAANRYFLVDVQAHYSSVNGVPLDAELVQGGQLLMMKAAK